MATVAALPLVQESPASPGIDEVESYVEFGKMLGESVDVVREQLRGNEQAEVLESFTDDFVSTRAALDASQELSMYAELGDLIGFGEAPRRPPRPSAPRGPRARRRDGPSSPAPPTAPQTRAGGRLTRRWDGSWRRTGGGRGRRGQAAGRGRARGPSGWGREPRSAPWRAGPSRQSSGSGPRT